MLNNKIRKHTALALFSGGLDSIICVKFMEKLGYKIIPIFFETPFFKADKARDFALQNNLDLQIIDITAEHLEMLKNPRYGYGKYMNPCIDCHGLMFRKAGEMLSSFHADFIISGEVLGQRPMSQRKDALQSVLKLSKVKDLIIRPLSQKLLPDTLPIREGWVEKDEMLDIQGRGRYRQIALAEELNISDYPNSGGGCLLTDKGYSDRLKDLFLHNQISRKQIEWLQIGRHFRLNDSVKMIVGRNESENQQMADMQNDELSLFCFDVPGPLGIILTESPVEVDIMKKAASLFLRYHSKANDEETVFYGTKEKLADSLIVQKMDEKEVKKYQI